MKKTVLAFAAAAAALTPAVASAEGGYVQVQSGWDNISVAGDSKSGVAYGVAAGYDFALSGSTYLGAEVSLDDSSTKTCADDVLVLGDRACAKTGRDIAAVAKLGFKISDVSSIYTLAGYTNARIKATYDDGTTSTSIGQNGDGVRVGAGYKQSFGTSLFGKVEYRYSNYESDFSRHQVLAAIGFAF